ncbi:MAG: hypothetical protein KDK70_12420 [Myxococcales bacterium]|nr:hypothetical protein [Myxococcales bacterium]
MILVGSCVLMIGACTTVDDGDYDDLQFRSDSGGRETPADPERPGGGGEWLSNGLQDPSVSGIDPAYPLTSADGVSESFGLLGDPVHRGTIEYIVECALPEGHSIIKTHDGQDYVFEGQMGLAPQWETGACDESCQQWISACILARTNVSEEEILVWVQSDHASIGFGQPEGLVHEASWYGNLFADPPEQYFCDGTKGGNVAAKRAGRTCSQGSGKKCGFTNTGDCDKHDRCTMAGPDADVPVDCKAGKKKSYSAPYHTIATYLPE